jgi:predicted ester cyclase
VAARYVLNGTHEGEFMGIEATGKRVKVRGMDFFRVSGGLIAVYWECLDKLSLLRQLGVIPGV